MNSITKTTPAGNDPFRVEGLSPEFLAANAVEIHEECGLPLADHCAKGCDECPRTPGPCYCDAVADDVVASFAEVLLGAALEQRYVDPAELAAPVGIGDIVSYTDHLDQDREDGYRRTGLVAGVRPVVGDRWLLTLIHPEQDVTWVEFYDPRMRVLAA